MIEIALASTDTDLKQILSLQKRNHHGSISEEQKTKEGFVTVRHNMKLLQNMNKATPQVIAKLDDKVVGYALVMTCEFGTRIPELIPMFQLFERLSYQGSALNDLNYYVMGQICIDESYRGMGVFQKLYEKHKEAYSDRYEICLTEISTSNPRSMRAHEKVGFTTIHTYIDKLDEWNVLAWDWH